MPPASLTIRLRSPVRLDIVRGPFLRVLLVMFFFHLAVFLSNPIFPIYQVRALKLTHEMISLGTSLFFVIHFLASMQMGGLSRRLGFKTLTGLGTIIASIATLIFTFSYHTWIYFFCQIFNGIGWAMI